MYSNSYIVFMILFCAAIKNGSVFLSVSLSKMIII